MHKVEPNIRHRVVTSIVSQVASQLFVAVLGVVALKIMTHSLGVRNYGTYATILAFVSTFSLLTDLGLNAITAREIAKNPEQADDIIGHNMGLRICLCIIMIPVIYGLSFAFYPHAEHVLRFGILLFSLYLFMDAIRSVSLAYFISKVRNEIIAAINALQQFIQLGLVILAAIKGWGVYGYVAIYLTTNLIVTVMAMYVSRKEVRIRPIVNLRRWIYIIKISVSLGVIQLINMMYLKADSIVLSTIKGTAAVGIYSIAYSLILAFLTLPGFIMTALIPSMATADKQTIQLLIDKALRYMSIFACLLAAGGFLVRNDIVPLVSGAAYATAATPFAILALASAFSYINSVFGFASVALNKHHKIVYISGATLVLNILLNILFIPRYSVMGAAWATTVSELLALIATYAMFRKQTGVIVNAIAPLFKPAIAAISVVFLAEILHRFWSTSDHLLNLLVVGFIILITYTTGLVLLRALPSEIVHFISDKRNNNHV